MTAYHSNCPPVDCGPCGTLPSGFVRLRYFYGKRLAVADFLDEQRYHSGKLRFHNQRLHGSGVLCGLRTDLFSTSPSDATILRVHRGAALDACGREIIVGWDQCIDVDAWLGRKLQAVPDFLTTATDPQTPNELPLCVVVRYRECPSSPEAAPRDACGCDTGGCDYGRIREEFELDLIAKPDAMITPAIFPPRDQLLPALALAPGGAAVADAIADLATTACPAPDGEGWVELACFVATLTDGTDRKHVTAIASIAPAETILYETALLQELVMRDLAATMEAGTLADGPQVTRVRLDSATSPGAVIVELSSALLAATVPQDPFALIPFTSSGWDSPLAVTTALDASGMFFTIKPPSGALVEGAQLRLALIPADPPMVDAHMHTLRPLRFSYHFTLAKDASGNLSIIAPAT